MSNTLEGLGACRLSLVESLLPEPCFSICIETQKTSLAHLTNLDALSRQASICCWTAPPGRNLELCETLREKQKRGSLLWVLDKTKTAMGARMLRSFIEQPLIDKKEIERNVWMQWRSLIENAISREEIREYLNSGLRSGASGQ
ncbi:MAG: hypothetical protein ACLUUO_15410 [Sellimonas intestinalis]